MNKQYTIYFNGQCDKFKFNSYPLAVCRSKVLSSISFSTRIVEVANEDLELYDVKKHDITKLFG